MPDPITGIIAGGALLGSSLISSSAAGRAAGTQESAAYAAAGAQERAAMIASETELEMYEQTREDLAPWREKGAAGLEELYDLIEAGPGEFEESPGYQFRLGEGVKALDRSASSGGMLFSGAHDKAITRFGQDYATSEYDNFLNRYYDKLRPWQSLSGVGQTATTTTADIGRTTAGNVAGLQMAGGQAQAQGILGAGQARAGGYINQANAWSGALNQGVGSLAYLYGAGKIG